MAMLNNQTVVDFPTQNGVFSIVMLHYQRVAEAAETPIFVGETDMTWCCVGSTFWKGDWPKFSWAWKSGSSKHMGVVLKPM